MDNLNFVKREFERAKREGTWKITREADMGIESLFGQPVYLVCDDMTVIQSFSGNKFKIKEVIFNNPATIVYWKDGTKTVVTDMDNVTDGKPRACESYSKEMGLALCFMKKALGNKGNYNNAFREWIKED